MTPLAVTSARRAAALPEVPTVAEAGFPGAEMDNWWGVFAPAGTPQQGLETLNGAIVDVMTSSKAEEFLANQGAVPAAMTQSEFAARVASEIAKWRDLAEAHGTRA